jgi:hypothetical protein
LEGPQNCLDHPIGVGKNVVVPEAQHFPILVFEPSRSARVCPALRMLAAIDFDHQPVFGAREVDDVVPNWMLSAEFLAYQPSTA